MQTAKSKFVLAIEKFEESLAKPMIPDFKHLADKLIGWILSYEVRHTLTAFGIVILLLCYAMMGLWGTITFMLGIFTVLAIQVILVFVYISYEHKRAQNFVKERDQDK